MPTLPVWIETGQQRVFAGAMDWPGWCRSGRDEATALQALLDYAPRYQAAVIRGSRIKFPAPANLAGLEVVERVPGNTTTDYGAPDSPLASDSIPPDADELTRWQILFKQSWIEFGNIVEAVGRPLRLGPRGGGRNLTALSRHVIEAEAAYLQRLGGPKVPTGSPLALRQASLDTLVASAHGEIPATGPRGGQRWTARRYIRRALWHILDHVWEIEDRAE